MKIIFHSGYVEFQMAPRHPADLWDWSSEEDIGSRRHIILKPTGVNNEQIEEKKRLSQRLRGLACVRSGRTGKIKAAARTGEQVLGTLRGERDRSPVLNAIEMSSICCTWHLEVIGHLGQSMLGAENRL